MPPNGLIYSSFQCATYTACSQSESSGTGSYQRLQAILDQFRNNNLECRKKWQAKKCYIFLSREKMSILLRHQQKNKVCQEGKELKRTDHHFLVCWCPNHRAGGSITQLSLNLVPPLFALVQIKNNCAHWSKPQQPYDFEFNVDMSVTKLFWLPLDASLSFIKQIIKQAYLYGPIQEYRFHIMTRKIKINR